MLRPNIKIEKIYVCDYCQEILPCNRCKIEAENNYYEKFWVVISHKAKTVSVVFDLRTATDNQRPVEKFLFEEDAEKEAELVAKNYGYTFRK